MIKVKSSVTDHDMGMKETIERVMAKAKYTDIGIQPDEDQTLLKIAAANEFGATINHPGGTAYGFKTQQDAKKHKITFLKSGQGYKVLGVTKAHTIIIPMRSYIRSTVDENEQQYLKYGEKLYKLILDGRTTKYAALSLMGQKIEGDIKEKILTLRYPANAKSTIRKKGSDNPLVDSGLLGGSIRYVVGDEGDEGDHEHESSFAH